MNQFIKEIQEQPEMLERTLGYYHSREGKERLDAVCTLWTTGDYDKIVLPVWEVLILYRKLPRP